MGIGLLVIDMQNDFCLSSGSLYVSGAEKDVERLVRLIQNRRKDIEGIVLTRDVHQVLDIAHPAFWHDRAGRNPRPFTVIYAEDLKQERWIPFVGKERARMYLRRLENERASVHTIWPEHCIDGSEGSAIVEGVMQTVRNWAKEGHFFRVIEKGAYPLSEHYGLFQAEVVWEDVPETWFNIPLLQELNLFQQIWIAGEARSHCVAATISQLTRFPEVIRKLVVLEDCMSPVSGEENRAEKIFEKARQMGACFTTSTHLLASKESRK